MKRQSDNPFDLTKASDYSDRQIQDYWVDIASGAEGLVDLLKPRSLMPMLLLGGKGSGKTHLMRYCSSTVQSLRHPDLKTALKAEGYLGIYARADGLNANRFTGKGQSDDVWADIFAYSFELWLVGTLLSSLRPALEGVELLDAEWNKSFAISISKIFHAGFPGNISTYDELSDHLRDTRQKVDKAINNCSITRKLEGIEVTFSPGDLVFGVPKILSELCDFAKDTVFLYLIDEVENFTEHQQKFLNSLVRYRRDNSTVKIGARLYGIKTYCTLGAGEPIKRDAEFAQVELDALLRETSGKYEELATKLVLKRIEAIRSTAALEANKLNSQFEELPTENYYQQVSQSLVKQRDSEGLERPHVYSFSKALRETIDDPDIVESIINTLRIQDHPLLEKTNLLLFQKKLNKKTDPVALANEIKVEVDKLIQGGPRAAPAYYDVYSHFSSDLLAQLYRDYGKKPVYCGFTTLIRLSQGVPRNLLSLLKHIYRRAIFAGEEPFLHSAISIDAQTQGIRDAADWFWEDSQPDAYGTLVRSAVENICTLLRSIRYADNPSECDLCCFRLDLERISAHAGKAIEMAENWSFLLRIASASSKNDERVVTRFQINPMLAPRWGISESRRGSIELKPELAEGLLQVGDQDAVKGLIAKRVGSMCLPTSIGALASKNTRNQSGLFDDA